MWDWLYYFRGTTRVVERPDDPYGDDTVEIYGTQGPAGDVTRHLMIMEGRSERIELNSAEHAMEFARILAAAAMANHTTGAFAQASRRLRVHCGNTGRHPPKPQTVQHPTARNTRSASRHRIITVQGDTRDIVVIGERLHDDSAK